MTQCPAWRMVAAGGRINSAAALDRTGPKRWARRAGPGPVRTRQGIARHDQSQSTNSTAARAPRTRRTCRARNPQTPSQTALSRFAAADAAPGRTRDASWQAGCIRLAGRVQANGPGAGWRRRSLAGLVLAGRPGAGPLQAGGPGALAGMIRSESRW